MAGDIGGISTYITDDKKISLGKSLYNQLIELKAKGIDIRKINKKERQRLILSHIDDEQEKTLIYKFLETYYIFDEYMNSISKAETTVLKAFSYDNSNIKYYRETMENAMHDVELIVSGVDLFNYSNEVTILDKEVDFYRTIFEKTPSRDNYILYTNKVNERNTALKNVGKSFLNLGEKLNNVNFIMNNTFVIGGLALETGFNILLFEKQKMDNIMVWAISKQRVSLSELNIKRNEMLKNTKFGSYNHSQYINNFMNSSAYDRLSFRDKLKIDSLYIKYIKESQSLEEKINEVIQKGEITIIDENGNEIDKENIKFSEEHGFYQAKASFDKGSTATKYDPIVIDLNADGKLTTTDVKDGVHFDLDNNGFKEKTAWIDADDGLLIMDRDGDGKISSGNELFGDQNILENGEVSSGGFMSLSELDENEDGKIDASDSKFSELRVWRDFNRNGNTDDGELFTLEDVQIESLSLNYQHLGEEDENGNEIVRTSSYKKTDGSQGLLGEFLLDSNGIDTRYDTVNGVSLDDLVISDDIMALPDISSYGTVYTLREAMATDDTGELKEKVEAFVTADNLE